MLVHQAVVFSPRLFLLSVPLYTNKKSYLAAAQLYALDKYTAMTVQIHIVYVLSEEDRSMSQCSMILKYKWNEYQATLKAFCVLCHNFYFLHFI